jgi:hypothetical protein
MTNDVDGQDEPRFHTPTIEEGVPGPRAERGFLLRAPLTEELIWDLEMEVAAVRRLWMPDLHGWWIASSYLQTVVSLVLRSFPSVLVIGQTEDHLLSRDGHAALQGRLL